MPIGNSDFRSLVKGKYFFYDRSLFIRDFLEDPHPVTMILRPRKFERTTTLKMVDYFCNFLHQYLQCFHFLSLQEIFCLSIQRLGNLETRQTIHSKAPSQICWYYCATCYFYHPVISLSFDSCASSEMERMTSQVKREISDAYNKHLYILKKKSFMNAVHV